MVAACMAVVATAAFIVNAASTAHHQREGGTGVPGSTETEHRGSHVQGAPSTPVSNRALRTDTSGLPISAMDGGVVRANGSWYLYGLSYGQCRYLGCTGHKGDCGFNYNHTLLIYKNSNLGMAGWELVATVAPTALGWPAGGYYRPKILQHPRSGEWVLWMRWIFLNNGPLSQQHNTFYLSASAPHITGPWTLERRNISTQYCDPGDFFLFVDEPIGDGYLLYTARDPKAGRHLRIEALTPDFLSSAWESGGGSTRFFGNVGEAPAMFQRRGVYYAVWGGFCCFCMSGGPGALCQKWENFGPNGTENGGRPNLVYAARHPLGPYTQVGDIGQFGQQNHIAIIGGDVVEMSNLWAAAPRMILDQSPQFWGIVQFNDSSVPFPTPIRVPWEDVVMLNSAL